MATNDIIHQRAATVTSDGVTHVLNSPLNLFSQQQLTQSLHSIVFLYTIHLFIEDKENRCVHIVSHRQDV